MELPEKTKVIMTKNGSNKSIFKSKNNSNNNQLEAHTEGKYSIQNRKYI